MCTLQFHPFAGNFQTNSFHARGWASQKSGDANAKARCRKFDAGTVSNRARFEKQGPGGCAQGSSPSHVFTLARAQVRPRICILPIHRYLLRSSIVLAMDAPTLFCSLNIRTKERCGEIRKGIAHTRTQRPLSDGLSSSLQLFFARNHELN